MPRFSHLPLVLAIILTALGGLFLLWRADGQARDTIRKHHLADLEQSLFFARELHGTFPPYDQASWCGLLNDPKNSAVRQQVEQVLRQQNDKYGNQAKPFPTDPVAGNDYFYWKRSPAVFELYAVLEQAKTNEKNTLACANAPAQYFDYGLTSRWREDIAHTSS